MDTWDRRGDKCRNWGQFSVDPSSAPLKSTNQAESKWYRLWGRISRPRKYEGPLDLKRVMEGDYRRPPCDNVYPHFKNHKNREIAQRMLWQNCTALNIFIVVTRRCPIMRMALLIFMRNLGDVIHFLMENSKSFAISHVSSRLPKLSFSLSL